MRMVVAAGALVVLAGLAPVSASADDGRRDGMSPPPPGSTSRPTRPPFHRRPIFPCCVGFSYFPEPAPPVIVVPPPPVVYVVPSPPALTYVPTPRPEPAPEIVTPSGRWARHGNGHSHGHHHHPHE